MTSDDLKQKAKRVSNGVHVSYEFTESEFNAFCHLLKAETANSIMLKYKEMDEILNNPDALGEYLAGI